MAYDKKMADRIRSYLSQSEFTEKRMFGSLCFMVDGKMCVCAGDRRMLCRLSLDDAEAAIQQDGIVPMEMRGYKSKHYVYIDENLLQADGDFAAWMDKALAFNRLLAVD